jgi:hypothetical protein
MREAGLSAAEQVRKESQQQLQQQKQPPGALKGPPPVPMEVQVDVEQLLRDPNDKPKSK